MPIYEYQCEQCGEISEALQTFTDAPLTDCVRCRGKLHKLISRSSFHLKGSGWYVTDYAKKSSSNTTSTASPKKDASTDSGSKTESTKNTKKAKTTKTD